ncbi:MAG: response regulator [Chloroflexi bacterium]|nr:MAG: response regulator [Chloroflexota bacterium]
MNMSVDRNRASSEDPINVKTILVVEDDEDIGSFIVEALLQETPHQALLVTTGSKALETVKTIKPNLFVLDYLLPRMNGIDLYDRLHATKELEHIPAIMMSANLPASEARKRKITCLKKPFELDELLQTIEKLIA